ncbi:MAG: hypothetical protein AAF843_17455, partial [Bacteroidota bacterium]
MEEYSNIKKCANPNCNKGWDADKVRGNKKYCSVKCKNEVHNGNRLNGIPKVNSQDHSSHVLPMANNESMMVQMYRDQLADVKEERKDLLRKLESKNEELTKLKDQLNQLDKEKSIIELGLEKEGGLNGILKDPEALQQMMPLLGQVLQPIAAAVGGMASKSIAGPGLAEDPETNQMLTDFITVFPQWPKDMQQLFYQMLEKVT